MSTKTSRPEGGVTSEIKEYALMAVGTSMFFGGLYFLATYGAQLWAPLNLAFVAVSLIGFIICCGLSGGGVTELDSKANAHLIASAPDMLAALKAVDAVGMLNPTGSRAVEAARHAVRAAIAKAEAA